MATSTPKANLLGEIRSAETVLFWAERVQILELIFFPAFTNVYPAFISCLWMVISTVINITYGLCFIERQLVRPFSFEPDFVFYAERVGFLFAVLNKLGLMEKGMNLGLDILKLTQLFLILRLVILVARSINNLDITEGGDEVIEKNMKLKIKKIAKIVISKCWQYSLIGLCWMVCAIGAGVRLGCNLLVELWNSSSEREKISEVKVVDLGAKVCEVGLESKLEEENKKDEVENERESVREEDDEDDVEVMEWIESETDEVISIPEGEEEKENKVEVEHERELVPKKESRDEKVMLVAKSKPEEVNEDEDESESEEEEEDDETGSEFEEEEDEEAETGSESEDEEEEEDQTGSESEEEEEDEDETGSESEAKNSKEEVDVLHLIRAKHAILLKQNKQCQAAVVAQIQLCETKKARLLAVINRLQSSQKENVDEVKVEAESKPKEENEDEPETGSKTEEVNEDEPETGSKTEEVNEDKSEAESETKDETDSESEEEEEEIGSESESEDSSEEECELESFVEKFELAVTRVFEEKSKQFQSVAVAEYEAHRKSLEEEKQALYLQTKELELKQFQSSLAEEKHAAESLKWEEEKAALTKSIWDYKTEKEELLNKYNELDQAKGNVEVMLLFEKKLSEGYKAEKQAFEGMYKEQCEKNMELLGNLSAELVMGGKMNNQIEELEAKCQILEEEKYDLMRELAAANYAYEYYRTPQRDSHAN